MLVHARAAYNPGPPHAACRRAAAPLPTCGLLPARGSASRGAGVAPTARRRPFTPRTFIAPAGGSPPASPIIRPARLRSLPCLPYLGLPFRAPAHTPRAAARAPSHPSPPSRGHARAPPRPPALGALEPGTPPPARRLLPPRPCSRGAGAAGAPPPSARPTNHCAPASGGPSPRAARPPWRRRPPSLAPAPAPPGQGPSPLLGSAPARGCRRCSPGPAAGAALEALPALPGAIGGPQQAPARSPEPPGPRQPTNPQPRRRPSAHVRARGAPARSPGGRCGAHTARAPPRAAPSCSSQGLPTRPRASCHARPGPPRHALPRGAATRLLLAGALRCPRRAGGGAARGKAPPPDAFASAPRFSRPPPGIRGRAANPRTSHKAPPPPRGARKPQPPCRDPPRCAVDLTHHQRGAAPGRPHPARFVWGGFRGCPRPHAPQVRAHCTPMPAPGARRFALFLSPHPRRCRKARPARAPPCARPRGRAPACAPTARAPGEPCAWTRGAFGVRAAAAPRPAPWPDPPTALASPRARISPPPFLQ
jgi:hypothetical protein